MPSAVDLSTRRKQLEQLPLGHLTVLGRLFRPERHMYIRARCSACGRKREYVVSNFLSGRTRDCRCQRAVKYGRSPLAIIFGHRYDAIRHRCRKGKIKCKFRREKFIRYLLQVVAEKHPEIKTGKTLAHYEIQRFRSSGAQKPSTDTASEEGYLCFRSSHSSEPFRLMTANMIRPLSM